MGFLGHLDTVPPGDLSNWFFDPFEPVKQEDFIYGRGASDMKSGISAIIALCLIYLRQGPPPVNISCFFTADEESDGIGIQAICEKGWFDSVMALQTDITHPAVNWLIKTAGMKNKSMVGTYYFTDALL
jgi:succinyl-diaminopimelate desuccinylase